MEDYLLVGQFRDLSDQIGQEVFEVFVAEQEQSEILIWFFKCNDW